MASKTTATSLEEHFRNVADVKELLRLAGLPMRDGSGRHATDGGGGCFGRGNNCGTQSFKRKEDCRDFSYAVMEWLNSNI